MKAKGKEMFGEYLKMVDGWLGKTPKWMMGEQYTVGDPYLLVFYRWANRAKLPVKEMKNYTALVDRVMSRKAVHKVMADEGITLD